MRKCLKKYIRKIETKNDDVVVDVAQRECSNIKCNASFFSNIQNIDLQMMGAFISLFWVNSLYKSQMLILLIVNNDGASRVINTLYKSVVAPGFLFKE